MDRCKSCNAEIFWIRTLAGKAMPCDPAELTVVTLAGDTVRGRVPHWVTCPTANEHRKEPRVQQTINFAPKERP